MHFPVRAHKNLGLAHAFVAFGLGTLLKHTSIGRVETLIYVSAVAAYTLPIGLAFMRPSDTDCLVMSRTILWISTGLRPDPVAKDA
jgi:hypothetical protein